MENAEVDSVNEYFKQLGKITQEIDRAEMTKLWKKVKKGNREAKNQIMEMNLRLVVPTAKHFLRSGIDLMDLIEEGNLGLMQAIEKFEPEKGYRFSTYAIYWIEQYIRKYIEEQSGSIKIPSHAWGNLKRWFRAWNELKETNGREPSLREMAAELNLSARQVKSIMDTLNAAKGVDSLTALVHEEEETTLEDLISDGGSGNPHDLFEERENFNGIRQILEDLENDRDRHVIALRYGLDDNSPKTLGEVAELLGISRERVRQIEERTIRLIRKKALKAGILELTPEHFHTTKLHSAMRTTRVKTNILGETEENDFDKLLRRAKNKAQTAEKTKRKSKSSAPKKTTAKKAAPKHIVARKQASAKQKTSRPKKAGKKLPKK